MSDWSRKIIELMNKPMNWSSGQTPELHICWKDSTAEHRLWKLNWVGTTTHSTSEPNLVDYLLRTAADPTFSRGFYRLRVSNIIQCPDTVQMTQQLENEANMSNPVETMSRWNPSQSGCWLTQQWRLSSIRYKWTLEMSGKMEILSREKKLYREPDG